MPPDFLIHSASQVLCLTPAPQRGRALGTLGVVSDGAVAVRDGRIVEVGPSAELGRRYRRAQKIDATGCVVMPGFVDPHTHAMWIGDRAAEFEQRIAGATYSEILAAGGGILSTVDQTRAASVAELVAATQPRLRRMLRHGTTTAEIKTGYGLDLDSELRMLEAIARLRRTMPMNIHATFLPAHAVPREYAATAEAYVEEIVARMLPLAISLWREMAGEDVPLFVDVFCEKGAFSLAQTRRILERARALGFRLKVHADEFENLGGTALAVELGAASADHLVTTSPSEIAALGASTTVAVGLPGTPFGLAQPAYTPARVLIGAGATLALASDLNPGTSPCESMQMAIAIACRYMRLTPAEAIAAATINAAAALDAAEEAGSLTPGKHADLIALEIPSYQHLGYRYGTNLVKWVMRGGKLVARG
jgi:imidazolonepropionase